MFGSDVFLRIQFTVASDHDTSRLVWQEAREVNDSRCIGYSATRLHNDDTSHLPALSDYAPTVSFLSARATLDVARTGQAATPVFFYKALC